MTWGWRRGRRFLLVRAFLSLCRLLHPLLLLKREMASVVNSSNALDKRVRYLLLFMDPCSPFLVDFINLKGLEKG